MKPASFIEGVSVALAASFAAVVLYTALKSILPVTSVIKLLFTLFSLAYIGYLLSRSQERLGRTTLIIGCFAVSAAAWVFISSPEIFGLIHLGLIWLVRSLYHYSSLFSALADLGLNSLALAAAIWATVQTDSLFVTTWCFFLTQAMFVYIPKKLFHKNTASADIAIYEEPFQQAHRAAEAALQRLSTIRK